MRKTTHVILRATRSNVESLPCLLSLLRIRTVLSMLRWKQYEYSGGDFGHLYDPRGSCLQTPSPATAASAAPTAYSTPGASREFDDTNHTPEPTPTVIIPPPVDVLTTPAPTSPTPAGTIGCFKDHRLHPIMTRGFSAPGMTNQVRTDREVRA